MKKFSKFGKLTTHKQTIEKLVQTCGIHVMGLMAGLFQQYKEID